MAGDLVVRTMMMISAEEMLFRTGMPTLLPGSWLKNGSQNLLCFWAQPQNKALLSSSKKRKEKLIHLRKNRLKEQPSVGNSYV